ncbi:MAG TPA: diacylglycerol kinase family protein [Bacteroidales bacterium]|nr:diacylglycerol kinase family protein [Bacteroidales bacterium]
MKTENFSAKSRLDSFRFAIKGLLTLIRSEHNARIHLGAALLAIASGIILKISRAEWMLIIIVIGMVFLAELINSSLEAIADVTEPEKNEKIGKAKDYAAASVLVSAIVSLIIGGLIFIPKIVDLL